MWRSPIFINYQKCSFLTFFTFFSKKCTFFAFFALFCTLFANYEFYQKRVKHIFSIFHQILYGPYVANNRSIERPNLRFGPTNPILTHFFMFSTAKFFRPKDFKKLHFFSFFFKKLQKITKNYKKYHFYNWPIVGNKKTIK